MFEKVFIDPGPITLIKTMNEAFDYANHNHKVRLVERLPVNEINQSHSGRSEANGGTRNVFHRETSTTGRLGMAWWTDKLGYKHVRIISDRHPVTGRLIDSIFGPYTQNHPDFYCVYPTALLTDDGEIVLECKCGTKGNVIDLGWDGISCTNCRQKDQYVMDTGFIPAVGRKF